jgi:hypothetical protein
MQYIVVPELSDVVQPCAVWLRGARLWTAGQAWTNRWRRSKPRCIRKSDSLSRIDRMVTACNWCSLEF